MSTILDALRKVESERESPRDHMLHAPAPPTEVRRARRIPVMLIASAVVAFAGGGMLSWWLNETPRVEVATLPAAVPPPAIPVPRPPVRARKVPSAAAVAEPATDAAPAPADAVPAPQIAAANPPAASVPPAAPSAVAPANEPVAAPAPPAVAAPARPSAAPAIPPVASAPAGPKGEVTGRLTPDNALAVLDKQASALEPSPFAAARGTQPAPGAIAPAEPGKRIPAPAKPAAPAAPPAEEKLAALTPPQLPEPAAPAIDTAPPAPPEAEPEAPAEPLFDTGRSPPGAPKVALSFLQWSADPAKRFAFISIDGAPSQRVHEGEVAAGMTVAAITQNGVQFKREGQTFVIRPRH